MRGVGRIGHFFAVLFLNLIFHAEWSIPAWILLILHFVIGIRLIWFWLALGVWIGGVLLFLMMVGRFYSWAARCGNTPDPPKKNVNPYSVGASHNPSDQKKSSNPTLWSRSKRQ